MIKVAITGPESSGKSSLAEALAAYYHEPFAQEFARQYLLPKKGQYDRHDLDEIAHGQQMLIRFLKPKNILFTDTEMLVMKIWSEFKYGKCSAYIIEEWHKQQYDVYVLCAPDIPYENDPLRENPNDREKLFQLYKEELDIRDAHYIIAEGSLENRLRKVISVLEGVH